jgi:hypothetical protein
MTRSYSLDMVTKITFPDEFYAQAMRVAEQMGTHFDQLGATALQAYLDEVDPESVNNSAEQLRQAPE